MNCRVAVLRRISALFALVFWLAATQHCALEAAGVWDGHCDNGGKACCTHDDQSPDDACKIVEGGSVRTVDFSIAVPSPELQLWLATVFETDAARQPIGAAPPQAVALDWVPRWAFVRRAAPPSRAPAPHFA